MELAVSPVIIIAGILSLVGTLVVIYLVYLLIMFLRKKIKE